MQALCEKSNFRTSAVEVGDVEAGVVSADVATQAVNSTADRARGLKDGRAGNALQGESAWLGFSVAHDEVTDVAVEHQ